MSDADASNDVAFVGSVPEVYERLLVPMIFEQPARQLATAIAELAPRQVLETAAGTGVLTRALVAAGHEVTATDLNDPMLRKAQELCPSPQVKWQVADAMDLPFADESFDVVACQFGVMFFPDKVAGYAEAARVLRHGGWFAFNAWDRIEANAVSQIVTDAVGTEAPGESLDFLRRTPHGYHDAERITRDLEAAGFDSVRIEPMDGTSRTTAEQGAIAYCQGTPLRAAIDASTLSVDRATEVATRALAERFGAGPFDAPTRWFQVTARRA